MLDLYVRPTIPFKIRCEKEKISRKNLITEIKDVSSHSIIGVKRLSDSFKQTSLTFLELFLCSSVLAIIFCCYGACCKKEEKKKCYSICLSFFFILLVAFCLYVFPKASFDILVQPSRTKAIIEERENHL